MRCAAVLFDAAVTRLNGSVRIIEADVVFFIASAGGNPRGVIRAVNPIHRYFISLGILTIIR